MSVAYLLLHWHCLNDWPFVCYPAAPALLFPQQTHVLTARYLSLSLLLLIIFLLVLVPPLRWAGIESVNWTISVTINGFYFQLRQNKNPKPKFMCPSPRCTIVFTTALCPFVWLLLFPMGFCVFCLAFPFLSFPGCHLGGQVLAKNPRRLCNLLQFPATDALSLSSCCLLSPRLVWQSVYLSVGLSIILNSSCCCCCVVFR